MTMKLTIKNDDASRKAKVTYVDGAKGTVKVAEATHTELAPGEAKEFWIHSTRELTIEEVQ